ncbi:MAG: MFS transporter [Rhizobiales bacterium]|nr:MFS transporter [Hyphomicrobiales bacterium]NRB13855.1 MFS transporter [Hyphomicrobiales bacterium]
MKISHGQAFSNKMSVSFASLFWGFAAYAVFFAPWLKGRGFDSEEVAFILAIALVVRSIFGPIGALLADGFKYKKTPLVLMNLLTSLSAVALYFVDNYVSIFIVVMFYSIATAAVVPILEGLAIKGADKFGFDFGRTRLWGSVAFIISSYACGKAIDAFGLDAFITWLLMGAVASTIASFILPVLPANDQEDGENSEQAKPPKFDLTGAMMMIKHPIFITILVTVSFVHASHAVFYGFSAIHWASLGYSSELIGILWAIGVFAEVLLFIYSGRITSIFGPRRMLMLAAAAAILRWVILAFDPILPLVFFAQTLHGLTFGAVYLGSLNLISRSVPDNLISTAMAINLSLNTGVFMSVALVISGWLYADYANLTYWFGALLGFIALIMALGLKFIWNGEALNFSQKQKQKSTN